MRGPLARPVQLAAQKCRGQFLRIKITLRTETAADIRSDHTQSSLIPMQYIANRAANDVGDLGGCIKGQRIKALVVYREAAAGLDGQCRKARAVKGVANLHISRSHGSVKSF